VPMGEAPAHWTRPHPRAWLLRSGTPAQGRTPPRKPILRLAAGQAPQEMRVQRSSVARRTPQAPTAGVMSERRVALM
jgi:hypothetical protein